MKNLQRYIENCFDTEKNTFNQQEAIEKIDLILDLLNQGILRIAEKQDKQWIIHSWIKKAILLAFRLKKSSKQIYDGFDKIGILEISTRFRKVPGAIIRNGVYVGNNAIVMPSYINIGAYIDDNTMIDINATIGSCAQIGKNCHISASSVIGGVLEPIVAHPVIIEDNCFIGAGSNILEGVIVEADSIIASGVTISGSTKIIDRATKETYIGRIPSGSVVVSGSYPSVGLNISCAIIIKTIDEKTKNKTSINELLRGNIE